MMALARPDSRDHRQTTGLTEDQSCPRSGYNIVSKVRHKDLSNESHRVRNLNVMPDEKEAYITK